MSLSKASGRKLQILPETYHESHQLDLLSFVSEYALAELDVKEKQSRGTSPRNTTPKVTSFHAHGNIDVNKNFSNFCVGKSNQFAVESIKRFISADKSDFGMIFLKAKSGVGKSHLLHAVGNEMLLRKKSYYFSSPLMMSPLVDTFNMLKFYDIILIDDIEELEGNVELQKVFCQLMDFAQSKKIKLLFTGTKLPKDLNGCDERTKGKLSASLIHHIDEMENDLAFLIVESKSKAMNLNLPDGVKRLVSNQVDFNVYGLEGLLYKFKNVAEISGTPVTMEVALDEIKDKKVIYRSDEFQVFLETVAKTFEVTREELMSSVRKQEFALARHIAMYLLKEKKRFSVMKIAELFERDHSSVVYAISRIKKIIEIDGIMKNKIETIVI